MKQELISVVVPIYNVEKYIDECIKSIINQTYKTLEIILVDDGSPDECGKICDSYAKNDSRINVIHKKNGGLSDARNVGIDSSNGEYITFVDGDDCISANMIEILYNNIKQEGADISCCKIKKISKIKIEDKKNRYTVHNFTPISAIKSMLYQQEIDNSACAKLYRKKIFDNIYYPLNMYFEDLATTYKLFLKSSLIVFTDSEMYYYYQREGSIIHTVNEKKIRDLYTIFNQLENDLGRYNELESALIYRKVNMYFYIYNNTNDKMLRNISKKNIKSNRNTVIKDKNVSKKTFVGIIISYFGFWLLKLLNRLR